MKLQSVAKEAADCRAAFAPAPNATHAWHLHHESLIEPLTEPAENRIAYILLVKPKAEQALRLRLFRPASPEAAKATAQARAAYNKATASAEATYAKATAPAWAAYNKATAPAEAAYNKATASAGATYAKATAQARAAYNKALAPAHEAECPDCPWNGRSIFA